MSLQEVLVRVGVSDEDDEVGGASLQQEPLRRDGLRSNQIS